MIPSIPYPGGKGRWAEDIAALLPQSGRKYVEPFAGRMNCFLAVAHQNPGRFNEYHLNDLKQAPFYVAVKEYGHRVRMPSDLRSAYYQGMKNRTSPRSLLLEPIVSRDGGGYGSGGPAGKNHASIVKYSLSLRSAQKTMTATNPTITSLDWQELPYRTYDRRDMVLFDPPYFGADVRAYTSKGFDYTALVSLLKGASFRWVLMEYSQPFYLKAFGRPFFERTVGHGSSRKAGRKVECMWKNF